MSALRLRAHITIDLEAADYAEAARCQARLEAAVAELRDAWGAADLKLAQRRPRETGPRPPRPVRHFTGALGLYDDA